MRVLRLLIAIAALAMGPAGAGTPEPWRVLPPTPDLPKAAESGWAPVDGVRIWYAEFGEPGGEPTWFGSAARRFSQPRISSGWILASNAFSTPD